MKCMINGAEVDARATETIGFQGGYQTKIVEYQGKEYVIIKDGAIWRTRTVEERFGR